MFKKIAYGILAIFGLILTLGSRGAYESDLIQEDAPNGTITISLVNWDSEIASSNVLAEAFRRAGFDPEIVSVENSIMWESLANGEADASVSAWLPTSHAAQYEQYQERIDFIGVNLENAMTGLAVPTYMDVDSIKDLTDEAGKVITSIEPGAGVVEKTRNLIEDYPNMDDSWTIATSSSGAMATQLGKAYNNGDEIIVTGWSPHWKFQKYDLKYLEDPQEHYGVESVYTMARLGLKEENPKAYKLLENFHWDIDDSEEVMLKINEGMPAEEAAREFVDNNPELLEEWLEGVN